MLTQERAGETHGCERDDEGGIVGAEFDILILRDDLLYSGYYWGLARVGLRSQVYGMGLTRELSLAGDLLPRRNGCCVVGHDAWRVLVSEYR